MQSGTYNYLESRRSFPACLLQMSHFCLIDDYLSFQANKLNYTHTHSVFNGANCMPKYLTFY